MKKEEVNKYLRLKCDALKLLIKGGNKNVKQYLKLEFDAMKLLLNNNLPND